jgi:RNA polymerase sigma-70 factor (ECF subfamily)
MDHDVARIEGLSPDHEWIVRLQQGDDAAYERLVREAGPRLLAVARRIVGDIAEAEEVVAETFASAFTRIARFNGGARLTTWLHRIAVNHALLRLRKRRTLRETFASELAANGPLEAVLPGVEAAADGPLLDAELTSALSEGIAGLSRNHRTVLHLRDIERRTPEETAAALRISRNAVKIRLHRARRALRGSLERRFGTRLPEFIEARERPHRAAPWRPLRRGVA